MLFYLFFSLLIGGLVLANTGDFSKGIPNR
jgi:hypothetical protein